MCRMSDLQRFKDAQKNSYTTALKEIQNGRKVSHWMWYIFPQIQGLGISDMSRYYAIEDLQEAKDYLQDEILGARLQEICEALLAHNNLSASEIFGSPDNMKLRSSMTLFEAAAPNDPVFARILDKFFDGKRDAMTLSILAMQQK